MSVNKVLPILPTEIITKVMRYIGEEVMLNITTGEYIENYTTSQLKTVLKKKTKNTSEFHQDVGESHWKRTDKIIIVPLHLEMFVRNFYQKLHL